MIFLQRSLVLSEAPFYLMNFVTLNEIVLLLVLFFHHLHHCKEEKMTVLLTNLSQSKLFSLNPVVIDVRYTSFGRRVMKSIRELFYIVLLADTVFAHLHRTHSFSDAPSPIIVFLGVVLLTPP